MNETFAKLALKNIRPTKIVDGKVYTLLTEVYTEKDKRQIKDELLRKKILHRIEPVFQKDVLIGYQVYILWEVKIMKVNVRTKYSNGQLETGMIMNKTDALSFASYTLENPNVISVEIVKR